MLPTGTHEENGAIVNAISDTLVTFPAMTSQSIYCEIAGSYLLSKIINHHMLLSFCLPESVVFDTLHDQLEI